MQAHGERLDVQSMGMNISLSFRESDGMYKAFATHYYIKQPNFHHSTILLTYIKRHFYRPQQYSEMLNGFIPHFVFGGWRKRGPLSTLLCLASVSTQPVLVVSRPSWAFPMYVWSSMLLVPAKCWGQSMWNQPPSLTTSKMWNETPPLATTPATYTRVHKLDSDFVGSSIERCTSSLSFSPPL